jgi:hypothetical protein
MLPAIRAGDTLIASLAGTRVRVRHRFPGYIYIVGYNLRKINKENPRRVWAPGVQARLLLSPPTGVGCALFPLIR